MPDSRQSNCAIVLLRNWTAVPAGYCLPVGKRGILHIELRFRHCPADRSTRAPKDGGARPVGGGFTRFSFGGNLMSERTCFRADRWALALLIAAAALLSACSQSESKKPQPAPSKSAPSDAAKPNDQSAQQPAEPSPPADIATPLAPGSGDQTPKPDDMPPTQPPQPPRPDVPAPPGEGGSNTPSGPALTPDDPMPDRPAPPGDAPAGDSAVQPTTKKEPPVPLVDNVEKLTRLDPDRPLWLDKENKRVVMVGQVCQTNVPLEMFACLAGTKEHESVVTVDVKAFAVHAALLALGATPGTSVVFHPEYKPASGPEIEVTVVWKDEKGKQHSVRAQEWIRNQKTGKAMEHPWVFAGSRFFEDEVTKQKIYMAEGGDFICVSNFPSAMLDLPVASPQDNADLLFEAFTERIPPRGTPVTLILAPKPEAKDTDAPAIKDPKEAPAASGAAEPSPDAPMSNADAKQPASAPPAPETGPREPVGPASSGAPPDAPAGEAKKSD